MKKIFVDNHQNVYHTCLVIEFNIYLGEGLYIRFESIILIVACVGRDPTFWLIGTLAKKKFFHLLCQVSLVLWVHEAQSLLIY